MAIQKVCVYCASSTQCDALYLEAARELGAILARNSITIVYGAGAVGSMGQLAEGALSEGGHVIGVLPHFMMDLEWGHPGLGELRLVEDLHDRKRTLLDGTDAVVALPGGSGTLDELLEAISLKRLAIYLNPIVLVNVNGFFDPCIELLDRCIDERFMDPRHRAIWQVVERPDQVLAAIESAPPWSRDALRFAAI
ncbi:MAG: TIGR00730 family Rossman fold protein [Gemmatimonadota bacterium]